MTRSHLVLIACFAGVVAFAVEARAGNKLFVGGLSWTTADYGFVDTSTAPATVVMDVNLSLSGRAGTLQNPGSTLPTSSSLGIINPGLDGLGNAGFFDVFYDGPAGDFPADSFFDIFTEITVPNSSPPQYGQSTFDVVSGDDYIRNYGFKVEISGLADQDLDMLFEINPNQAGLRFGNSSVDHPTISSFFDVFTELQFDGPGSIVPSLPLFRVTLTSVPEPSTWVLATAGVIVLLGMAHKRRQRSV